MRPSPTAGAGNFADCPMPATKRGVRLPFGGTASYARSCEPVPSQPDDHVDHNSAEPERVPSEVTTTALEPYPNASFDVPAAASVGVPSPDAPTWNARRHPDVSLGSGQPATTGRERKTPSPGHADGFAHTPPKGPRRCNTRSPPSAPVRKPPRSSRS